MTGAAPDRRQDLGPCTECGTPHDACTGPDWCCQECLHLDADWEGYRQPADEQAASPVPGQQREAVARWLWDWLNAAGGLFRADEFAFFQAKADQLLALLAATRDGEQA